MDRKTFEACFFHYNVHFLWCQSLHVCTYMPSNFLFAEIFTHHAHSILLQVIRIML